jgi:hypothetical protein
MVVDHFSKLPKMAATKMIVITCDLVKLFLIFGLGIMGCHNLS